MCSTENGETLAGSNLANMLLNAMSKLDKLTKELSYLQKCLQVPSDRSQELEISDNENNEGERRVRASRSYSRVRRLKVQRRQRVKKQSVILILSVS